RCDRGGALAASGRGVATVQSNEAPMAWARAARTERRGRRVAEEEGTGLAAPRRRGGASGRGVATVGGATRPRWRGREARTTTTAEVTTTPGAGERKARRCRARWGAEIDDNYGGGDDNYPRVVEMGAVGR